MYMFNIYIIGKMERVGRMLQMHANERTEVKEARAGDIVALCGLKDTVTGIYIYHYIYIIMYSFI